MAVSSDRKGKVFETPPVKIDVTTATDKPFNLKQVGVHVCTVCPV